jgi:hypothetical protein
MSPSQQLQAAIVRSQQVRGVANTIEMLEMQVDQMSAEIAEKAELADLATKFNDVLGRITAKAEADKNVARQAVAAGAAK